MQGAEALAVLVIFSAAAVVLLQIISPYIYQYHLTDVAFEVRLFGSVSILVVNFTTIEEVRVLSWLQLLVHWNGIGFPNRFFATRPVLIRRNKGWLRKIILTPKDAQAFVAEINRR